MGFANELARVKFVDTFERISFIFSCTLQHKLKLSLKNVDDDHHDNVGDIQFKY